MAVIDKRRRWVTAPLEVRETVLVYPGKRSRSEPTRRTIHGEHLVDDTRRLRLSIAQVELPDGVCFEQYVLRMPKAAMTVLLDDAGQRVLMIWAKARGAVERRKAGA